MCQPPKPASKHVPGGCCGLEGARSASIIGRVPVMHLQQFASQARNQSAQGGVCMGFELHIWGGG